VAIQTIELLICEASMPDIGIFHKSLTGEIIRSRFGYIYSAAQNIICDNP
jgi:hypothetical protein